jgi:hypothetical protein
MQRSNDFRAFVIKKLGPQSYLLTGWYNRAIAMWACDPATEHLWRGNARLGKTIARTETLVRAHDSIPQTFSISEGFTSPETELWLQF